MMLIFLPRYPKPCKVPTNPRWCPYAKSMPCEGQALHLGRVTPRPMGLLHVRVVLRFWLLSDTPHRLHYRASDQNATGLIPPVHGGDRDTNSVVMVSQDFHPTRYNYNGSRKSRWLCVFSKLTQLTRIHLDQEHKQSN
jgi:hypothetical protein